ncbi:MAG: uroporphyrinogen decarboxylase [Tannerellaceae bacterium]|nr:uroporphyrinogen decarboxylase [Tannerellaceae bacterium]
METILKNDLILRVLRGENVERVPVWMMRQAGRFLPEYRKLREKYTFFERCKTPELACEITLQPIRRLGVDAAILFSDILVVPEAMGVEVQLVEKVGPILPSTIRRKEDLKKVRVPDIQESLGYVFDAIRLIRQELAGQVPLIGFAGAPWTLLCYMVQGKGSKTFDEAKRFCYTSPEAAHSLLQMITDTTITYLEAQIEAGADLVQLFDSWAGLVGPEDFSVFCQPYIHQIVSAVKEKAPVIVFAKGAWHSLPSLRDTGTNALGIDWCLTPELARTLAGGSVVLQGNFDPAKLYAPIPFIEKEVGKMLERFGKNKYIANLGHGILPDIPVEHAKAFVETVKNYSWNN